MTCRLEADLMDCDHDWNTASALRLVIESYRDVVVANLFPRPPTMIPADYCRSCGLVRLRLATLPDLQPEPPPPPGPEGDTGVKIRGF